MKITQFIVMVVFLTTSSLFSQITGKVKDGDYPLEYATATLFSTQTRAVIAGVVTDIKGNFKINNLQSGNFYLEISFIGFEKK